MHVIACLCWLYQTMFLKGVLASPQRNFRVFRTGCIYDEWCAVHIVCVSNSWLRHQMNVLSTILALCEGNPPISGGFSSQRPLTWSFDDFFALRLNKRLSKQSRHRWFETPSRPLWRHCNVIHQFRLRLPFLTAKIRWYEFLFRDCCETVLWTTWRSRR